MAITNFQEASNEVAVTLFCHAYNCTRYTSFTMINDGFHFTAVLSCCILSLPQY